jgi:antitoxin PrlF
MMLVSEKGQVTIPKKIRTAAGVQPGTEAAFSIESGRIIISKLGTGVKSDRRAKLRTAAAKVRASMSPEFRQMSADEIMSFLRADGPAKVMRRRAR